MSPKSAGPKLTTAYGGGKVTSKRAVKVGKEFAPANGPCAMDVEMTETVETASGCANKNSAVTA